VVINLCDSPYDIIAYYIWSVGELIPYKVVCRGVVLVQPSFRSYPKVAVAVFIYRVYIAVAQTIGVYQGMSVDDEFLSIEFVEAIPCSEPEIAFFVLDD